MKFKNLIKDTFTFKATVYILTLAFVLIKAPMYSPDSYAHMDMLINRSVLYSLVINLPKIILGYHDGYVMIIIHFFAFYLSVNFFIKQIKNLFQLSNYSCNLLVLIFCFSAIFVYSFITHILSEAITFPLLLACIGVLMGLWRKSEIKKLAYFLVFFFLLTLARSQFVVLLPIFLVPILVKVKLFDNRKLVLIIVVAIISVPFLSKLTEHYYYKIVFNEDIGYTMTFVHLISGPFYVSSIEDQSLFTNEEERSFFVRTKKMLDSKNLSYAYAKANDLDEFDYYQSRFTEICNATIHEANMSNYGKKGLSFYDQHRKVDEMTTQLFFPLLKKNYKQWLVLVFKGVKKGLGRSYAILMLVLLSLLLILFFRYGLEEVSYFFLWVLALKLLHHLFVAIAVHSIQRYLFYFDWLIPVFIVVLADKLIHFQKSIYERC